MSDSERRKVFSDVPTYKELMQPVLEVLQSLGGSGTVAEINERVITALRFTEEASFKIYEPDKSGHARIKTNLSWARSYLKKSGLIENSQRAVWSLAPVYKSDQIIDVDEIARQVRGCRESESEPDSPNAFLQERTNLENQDAGDWKDVLQQTLLSMKPDAFERLVMRILRESGFVQVEVTGRSGDGGIDGKGIAKLQGILSFHVVFQCKRYKDSISSAAIRDFRGAMIGRADKGLFITTGAFTNEAIKEATRAGAPPIDLVDGEDLALMLKQLRLGINVRMVEEVTVNMSWFSDI